MKYNSSKPFAKQTQAVRDYIWTKVVDQRATPTTTDNLGRPDTFDFPFTDSEGVNYNAQMKNVYIDNRSWRLDRQEIVVTKIEA